MDYEVIIEIKNSCSGNQKRDVSFLEIETDDIEAWLKEREPHADLIEREDLMNSIVFRVWKNNLLTEYSFSK